MQRLFADDHWSPPELDADNIHVWRLQHDQRAGRSRLLQLLGRYVDAPPDALHLQPGQHGRPSLTPPHDHLHFNWSHSGGVALVAIARELPQLGIDVEIERPRRRMLELAQRFFSTAEYQQLKRVPPALRLHRFLQLWTAKEAVLKAHGHGVSYGLHRVEFSVEHDLPRPQRFAGNIGEARDWHLHVPDIGADVIAHLAWQGASRNVRCFRADDNQILARTSHELHAPSLDH